MNRLDHARLLMSRAAEDEAALDILLAHGSAPVTAIEFDAHQAAERLIKAAISGAGLEYPLTHNIRALMELARDAGVAIPVELGQTVRLTPFEAAHPRSPGVGRGVRGRCRQRSRCLSA